jgi:hypothetical protein
MLTTEDGSSAAICDGRIQTRDRFGRVIFEYDPETGRMTLSAPGAVTIRSEERIDLEAPEIGMRARKLEHVVGRVVTFAKNLYLRIASLFHSRAGRVRSEAEGSYLVEAGHARVRAVEDVKIVGESIELG